MTEISAAELRRVITDFIDMGHVDNIVAMFKQDSSLYAMTGDLLRDQRLMVRMGLAILFEELVRMRPAEAPLAIVSLAPLLCEEDSALRGEAANILGIIGTDEALTLLNPLRNDPDPQVAEIVRDILGQ